MKPANISLWQATAESTDFHSLNKDISVDVAVIGGWYFRYHHRASAFQGRYVSSGIGEPPKAQDVR
jgi:hypothetical protein